jgi:hypothetical protein
LKILVDFFSYICIIKYEENKVSKYLRGTHEAAESNHD